MENHTFPELPAGVKKLLNKKEFIQYKVISEKDDTYIDKKLYQERILLLHAHQLFIKNLMSPTTPYKRLIVKHGPGTGKTNLALMTAFEYIRGYTISPREFIGNIYIIGFSKQAFHDELLTRPEYGIVTPEDIATLTRLQKIALTGTDRDVQIAKVYEIQLKKRLTRSLYGKFYKFIGYKGFFNQLFKVVRINDRTSDVSKLSENELKECLISGDIHVNKELLLSFRNSFVILDEIHNVYNSVELNNYGIALKFLFNTYDTPELMRKYLPELTDSDMESIKFSVLKALLMSATIINNSPTEIVDLLNLVIPLDEINKFLGKKSEDSTQGFVKSDLFSDNRNLIPGRMEKLIHMHLVGRVSFLQDDNPKFFPSKKIHGEQIRIPGKYRGEIVGSRKSSDYVPYMRFIRCEMSKFHLDTLRTDYPDLKVPMDSYGIFDIALPNPEDEKLGIYRTKDIKTIYKSATSTWLHASGVTVSTQGKNTVIGGNFLNIKNVKKYSAKYYNLISDILKNTQNNGGKILISHQFVQSSGVLLLQELLRANGFIDEYSNPGDETICSICGKLREKHIIRASDMKNSGLQDMKNSGSQDLKNFGSQDMKNFGSQDLKSHNYTPARFIVYHADIQSGVLDISFDKYNNPGNMNGHQYKVFIGSKIINESKNFNYVRSLHIVHVPSDYSTLVQIIGRAVRKNSHKSLPPELQNVDIYCYTSAFSPNAGDLSPEEYRYFEKSQDYVVIQHIDKLINQIAIDSIINRDIIEPSLLPANETSELGTAYFKIDELYDFDPRGSDTNTFTIYNNEEEIHKILYIIKRLFIEYSGVWQYDDLWQAVRDPPFNVYVNSEMFDLDNFNIVLHFLTARANRLSYKLFGELGSSIANLLDYNNNRIEKAGVEFEIINIDDYFIMFPTGEDTRSENAVFGQNMTQPISKIYAEDFYRHISQARFNKIYITSYLQLDKSDFYVLKYNFYNKYRDYKITELPTSFEIYDLNFHVKLCEDCIAYVFNILTNPEMPTSEIHNFYLKMLYFYDTLGVLMFADNLVDTNYFKYYTKYCLPAPGNELLKSADEARGVNKYREFIVNQNYNHFLMTSFAKRTNLFEFNPERINQFINKKISVTINPKIENMNLSNYLQTRTEIKKVFAKILPVGHFLADTGTPGSMQHILKLYNPEGSANMLKWIEVSDLTPFYNPNIEENDEIIGFYAKLPNSIDWKFKIREPIQKIVSKHTGDSRKTTTGVVCGTKKKEELMEIIKKLQIEIPPASDESTRSLCDLIRNELMWRELKAQRDYKHLTPEQRAKKKQIKWFYLSFEQQLAA